jgi:hypothetical protein
MHTIGCDQAQQYSLSSKSVWLRSRKNQAEENSCRIDQIIDTNALGYPANYMSNDAFDLDNAQGVPAA